MFSKACEYGIKAAIYIAQETLSGRRTNVKEISAATNSPEAFVAKILQPLSKSGIVLSHKGKQGGFSVDLTTMSNVNIYDIVKIIDGERIFTSCGLGLHQCSESSPCPIHEDYKVVRDRIFFLCNKYSLKDLAERAELGLAWLK